MVTAAIAVALGFALIKECGKRKDSEAAVVRSAGAEIKALQAGSERLDSADHKYKVDSGYWAYKADSLLDEVEVLRYERNQGWQALSQTKDSVQVLAAKVKSEGGKNDTTCLQLQQTATSLYRKVGEYEGRNRLLIANMDALTASKDSIIKVDQYFISVARASARNCFDTAMSLAKKVEKLQPRNSLWIGVDGSFSPFVQQVGGHLMFQNKRGTAWQFGAGLTSEASYYGRVGISWKISLRKK